MIYINGSPSLPPFCSTRPHPSNIGRPWQYPIAVHISPGDDRTGTYIPGNIGRRDSGMMLWVLEFACQATEGRIMGTTWKELVDIAVRSDEPHSLEPRAVSAKPASIGPINSEYRDQPTTQRGRSGCSTSYEYIGSLSTISRYDLFPSSSHSVTLHLSARAEMLHMLRICYHREGRNGLWSKEPKSSILCAPGR